MPRICGRGRGRSACRERAGGTGAASHFPQGYEKWQLYATVDRYDSKQYRELYAKPEVVKAVREGRPIPDGTVLVMAIHAAKVDDKGVPQKDAKGRFIKDKLAGVTVMEKRKGLGRLGSRGVAQCRLAVRVVHRGRQAATRKRTPASRPASSATSRTRSRTS